MKRVKVMAFLVLAAFLAFSCSKDSSDDSTPTGGGNTTGNSSAGTLATHSGTNTVVTSSNVETVTSTINTKASDVFSRAMSTIKYSAKPAVDILLDGNVNGNKTGKAVVKGKYVMSSDQKSFTYNFTCTFYDFSDDNALFLGGLITYTGSYNLTTSVYDLVYTGGLKFNGIYEGTQDFVTKYKSSYSNNVYNTTIESTTTTTSGGKSFTSTYKYPK